MMPLILAVLSGCGGAGNSGGAPADGGTVNRYRTEPVAGKINGATWTFVSGIARNSPYSESTLNLIFVGEATADPCAMFPSKQIMTSVKANVGLTPLGQAPDFRSVTFFWQTPEGGINKIATEGSIDVQEITATEVVGRMIATFDGVTFVNGTFRLKICGQ